MCTFVVADSRSANFDLCHIPKRHSRLFDLLTGQINPKPCSVNGVEGTCMFVYECIKTEGRSVGMCVDNFMFGSCCSHNITANDVLPHHSHPNVLYSPTTHTSHSSLR